MPPLRVGHFVSGGGTTMQNVAQNMLTGNLGNIEPVIVIADRECGALDKAHRLNVPTEIITKREFPGEKWAHEIARILSEKKVDIIFQNGWVPLTPGIIVNRWKGSIYNQHPGPLSGDSTRPDFGGKGMCGADIVTAARVLYLLESDEDDERRLTTESTIHEVSAGLDEGRLVRIEKLSLVSVVHELRKQGIKNIDSAKSKLGLFQNAIEGTRHRLLMLEHKNVAEVLRDRANGLRTIVTKDNRSEQINGDILARAKETAIALYSSK